MSKILHFKDINKDMVGLVGGKGASLGELYNIGMPVPDGFVITTEVFKDVRNAKYGIGDVKQEILDFFDKLGAERVAVRSSATVEDAVSSSWAGQLESYLNVNREGLLGSMEKCWHSVKSESAMSYAESQGISPDKLVVAVVVQIMVDSEVSGVMFSVNPINKDLDEVMIEACRGLGEMLVQGMITPNSFVVSKSNFEIISRNISNQDTMLVYTEGETKEVSVSESIKNKSILSEDQIETLARLSIKLESHYKSPQDIEWALSRDTFYILQSRPITTL